MSSSSPVRKYVSDDSDEYTASPKKKQVVKTKAPAKGPKKVTGGSKKAPLKALDLFDDLNSEESSSATLSTANAPKGSQKKTIEEIYQKKTQLEHILLRPDSYIGSTEALTTNLWVYENEGMVHRSVTYAPGLYKIFDEIIVNAADNKVRDPGMDTIKVFIDKEENLISVYNNGHGIPIEMHAKEKIYVPELIFGHLLTSSNYDDDEKKVTGGRNGYGAKLCNIFSTEFIVETADSRSGKKFKQVFRNNMGWRSDPEIKANPKGEAYTRISFKPDLARFHMKAIDNDFEALLNKRVHDLAGCLRGVKVYLNNVRIKIKDFKDYVELYLNSKSMKANETEVSVGASKTVTVYDTDKSRWEVIFAVSDGQFQQVSFVNSICTIKGGTHVNYIADQIVTQLIEAVKKKDKKGAPVKPFQAKNHLFLFVNCLIENPTFDSQTKETMTLRAGAFGSKFTVSEEFMKKVLRSGVVDNIVKFVHFKENQMLKKTDGSKKSRISGITKLDDANNAGTRNAGKCTLILTEGDSAKSLAVSGLSVVGRDNYGVFPLRGKLLNVREAAPSQISGNAEINAIKQIMGLQHGKVYDSADSLRYGHLMIMTDQDHDGSHIKGLIINFLDHFWPSLLKIPGFLLEFITPIVKVSKGKGNNRVEKSFFTIPEYETWKQSHEDGRGWTIKYYKGLGTSTLADAKVYFSDMNKHLKPFSACIQEERELVDMAFNKKKADERKEWLRQFQPGTFMDYRVAEIPIADFINHELILFSMADNIRSIPSVMDGFKPGQRKILFACFKRNLKDEIKVAQLAGYVSEHAAYHHGEQSLCGTVVNMAQNYIGANNLTFLDPVGQFGTRLQGGKDAASPRYIFTNLTAFARSVFHPADDALLKTLTDDGQSIEPEWYLPILPMILINGADGIGTGWSTSLPNYNPRDIVANMHRYMQGEELADMHPWYRGFTGTIEYIGKDRYKVTGTIRKINETTVEITELPIKVWTQSYKEQLEEWYQGTEKQPSWIKDYKEYHTDSSVHFVVTLTESNMAAAEKEGLENKFKLVSQISTTNMVCFDRQGRIRKYANVNEILVDFCDVRKEFYQRRKEYRLNQLAQELARLENRARFIAEIISGKLVVQNRKKADIIRDLKSKGYAIYLKGKYVTPAEAAAEQEDSDFTDDGRGYEYLMSMSIWSLTAEKVQALLSEKAAKEEEIRILIGQSIFQLWQADLDSFLARWDDFEKSQAELESSRPSDKTGKKKSGLGAAKKKKVVNLSESDVSMNDPEDEDDDFSPVKKKKAIAAKKASPVKPKKELAMPTKTTSTTVSTKPSPVSKVAAVLSGVQLATKPSLTNDSSINPPAKKRVLSGKKAGSDANGKSASAITKFFAPAGPKAPPILLSSDPMDEDSAGPNTKPLSVPKKTSAEPKMSAATKKPVTANAPNAPTVSKKKNKIISSDDEEEEDEMSSEEDAVVAPPVKKAPVPRRAVTAKKPTVYTVDSDETEAEEEEEDAFSSTEEEDEDDESDFDDDD